MVVGLTFQEAGIVNPLVFVEDGRQAIDYLTHQGEYADSARWPLPILMILDLNLPKYDGFEVLAATERVRQENDISVVVLSVSNTPEDIDRAIAFGATKVLCKPIASTRLLEVTSEIEDFSLLLVAAKRH